MENRHLPTLHEIVFLGVLCASSESPWVNERVVRLLLAVNNSQNREKQKEGKL